METDEAEDVNLEGVEEGEIREVPGDQYEMRDSDAMESDHTAEEGTDGEEEQFDITLTASHSYMGEALEPVSGRSVVEGGWRGRLAARAHHAVLFPGETVPMLLASPLDADVLADILAHDKLIGLLCPDETFSVLSGYGVVCEVFEAALEGGGARGDSAPACFKARAVNRFRLRDMPRRPLHIQLYMRLRYVQVEVLPELRGGHALRHARLAALDPLRAHHQHHDKEREVRRLDAAVSPWPSFVFDVFDFARMRRHLHDHFLHLGSGLERLLPSEPVALSFWVASNLTLSARDRLALFVLDNALLRLHMECTLIDKLRESVLCCATCGSCVARQGDALAMSPDGAHANYTNPGGFLHDVITLSAARNLVVSGAPSAEYSWFPGYVWAAASCALCDHHLGWRFNAARRELRPRRFFALCRNYVVAREAERAARRPTLAAGQVQLGPLTITVLP